MGVNGLWTVIQPCARPTNLATLNRKRLAVDASIWIYQFLKAVRDKEGNALRNSHIVGFFRRVCKLLWFGILPVFVFDGGAPALKRETIQKRQRRREGRREDAVRTAGKLLAVQMQRVAVEEEERRKRDVDGALAAREARLQQEDVADPSKVVYMDEIGMSQKEKAQSRKFFKQDAYHLPELQGGIASMGKPDDPRIMSVEELEQYARQFNNGEDINFYDFSKIDFDGDFFKSLPPADRYNILNAARLRSRLRLGYSKDQLDDMFPDRMAFSRFQIERVKERNHLTQRLMLEAGMHGTDLTLAVNARIAGDKDREYILVKNEGAEGGWALGVVSKEKDVGEAHKPIDVDAIEVHFQSKDAQEDDEDEDEDFEDIPIEGVNRLPRTDSHFPRIEHTDNERRSVDMDSQDGQEGSLFVGDSVDNVMLQRQTDAVEKMHPEEADEVQQAIALSLKNQHAVAQEDSDDEMFEDVPIEAPDWKQTAVERSKPIKARSGAMIAHIVNNRANAAVPKRSEEKPKMDSDSEDDLQAVLAQSRKSRPLPPKPVIENKKNPFDGPLPFPKLDWGASLFANRPSQKPSAAGSIPKTDVGDAPDEDTAGGFERQTDVQDAPKPIPPWLQDGTDIRDSLRKQQDVEREINAEDKQEAEEEARIQRREMENRIVEIESSDDDDEDDVQVLEVPSSPPLSAKRNVEVAENGEISDGVSDHRGEPEQVTTEQATSGSDEGPEGLEKADTAALASTNGSFQRLESHSASPEPVFENVPAPAPKGMVVHPAQTLFSGHSESADGHDDGDGDVDAHATTSQDLPPPSQDDDEAFMQADADDFSEPEDEELMMQMAEEAEEHARFASELNQKSTTQNREEYEKELRALRSQQKKDRRDADEVTQVMITECQALLRLFGIPYITAPMEAEAQCAELVRLGTVDGIVTDDSDTFLFGGTRVYKNMFNGNKFVECYLGADLENELSLSREQLISLAQLLGSDYTEGLSGVGPVTAVEILSEFPGQSGLDRFREWWTAVQSQKHPKEADAGSPFRKKFRKSQAIKLFLPHGFPSPAVYDAYSHPEVDKNSEPFQWGVPNLEGLRQFLMSTIGWSKERTDEVLVPVIRDMNKRGVEGTQSNITRFFGGGVGVGAKEAFAPRQRAQGSKRMAAAVDRLRAQAVGEGQDGGGVVDGNGDGDGDGDGGRVTKVHHEEPAIGRKRRRTAKKANGRGSQGIEA